MPLGTPFHMLQLHIKRQEILKDVSVIVMSYLREGMTGERLLADLSLER